MRQPIIKRFKYKVNPIGYFVEFSFYYEGDLWMHLYKRALDGWYTYQYTRKYNDPDTKDDPTIK